MSLVPCFIHGKLSVLKAMSIVPQRPIGKQGLLSSAQGLGCMGMTTGYGDFDRSLQETESLRTFARGLELGINFVDTAWAYQSYGAGGGDYIDLYYQHRMDPATPIEETVGVLKKEGVVRYIGLSECTPDELRRAHAVHPVTAMQMEWSLQTRDIEDAIVPLARELGVAIVAYSPLGRGFLAALNAIETLDAGDWRRNLPRFSGDMALENTRLAARFFALAEEKGCTAAQLALAWIHAQGEDVFPIPGTKSAISIEENARAIEILRRLTPNEIEDVAAAVQGVVGDRYPADLMASTYAARM